MAPNPASNVQSSVSPIKQGTPFVVSWASGGGTTVKHRVVGWKNGNTSIDRTKPDWSAGVINSPPNSLTVTLEDASITQIRFGIFGMDASNVHAEVALSPWYTVNPANTAPTVPPSITVPTPIKGGTSITVSWGASTDVDGNMSGYRLEQQVDGGDWAQIAQTAATSFSAAITKGWNTVAFRVKAYDSGGLESAYRTSATYGINNAGLLGELAPRAIVKIKENGVLQDFYVTQHGYPTASNGRTLLVRRYIYDLRQWHSSNANAYASSTIDAWLNGAYFNLLPADIQRGIAAVSIHYTPGNGVTGVSTLSRKVFLLSATEIGHNFIVGSLNSEGTVLPYASTLLRIVTDSVGVAQAQWTRSPNTFSGTNAWRSFTDGSLADNPCSYSNGSRPCFTLPSTALVSDSGEIIFKTAPTISGSDSDLGTKTAGFTQAYTVTDPDDNEVVVVTEYIDGQTIRAYTVTLGEEQTADVSGLNFLKQPNGSHTLTITATDKDGLSATRTYTFTKHVTTASIILLESLPADAMPVKAALNAYYDIAPGAEFKFEICNNGNDDAPTWEDCTSAVVNNKKFFFTNTEKTAEAWGVKVRFTADRKSAVVPCHITAIGGFFE